MGDASRYRHFHDHPSHGSALLLSAAAGALLGAAGLAWWLLSEAERRRLQQRQQRLLHLSRLQDGTEIHEAGARQQPEQQRDLHDKVHELNQAIDEVRRQLEAMASPR
jgi:TolA-binding protein